jgi:hypothetical protein
MGVAQAWFGCMRLGFLCTGCATVLLRSTLQPLSAVGLSRRHLLSAGVPAEAVERLYRMLCARRT